jgi:hypothetical protein
MAITSNGTRDQPQVASSGNTPDFAADLTGVSDFFAVRSLRRFSTVALLLASSGSSTDDYAVATNAPGAFWRNTGSGWTMYGVAHFADAAARSTAITAPAAGMLSYLLDTKITYVYDSAWKPLSGAFPYVEYRLNAGQTFTTGSAATIDLDASPVVSVGAWSESTGVVTVPLDGYYSIDFWGQWAASATGIRDTTIYVGGTTNAIASEIVSAAVSTFNHVHREIYLAAASTVRVRCAQNSGGNLALNEYGAVKTPLLTIRYLGPR